jgi:hypothetical protein
MNSKITPAKLFAISAIILVFAAAWGWYGLVYSSPSAVFERMLFNNLATTSAYKVIAQKDTDQQLDQKTQLLLTPSQRVYSTVALRQGADAGTLVSTESVGTTSADYVRYADIKTTQKTADGKAFDFSSVLGIWGKSDADDTGNGGAQLYNQSVLGVVPIGNLSANQRQKLLNQIKDNKVYSIDYSKVNKSFSAGRLVYSYDITVKPEAYVLMLKAFARDIGLKQLESVDPSQYADAPPLQFSFDVDVLSGQLTKITYKDSERTELFSSYGAIVKIDIPDKTVPVQDLQSRLQQIQ